MIYSSIGLMSGTSMDGIDACLIRTDGMKIIEEIGSFSLDYDVKTRIFLKDQEQEIKANYKSFTIAKYQDLTAISTKLHIKAVSELMKKLKLHPQDIDVIGYHGQTIYHNPEEKISIIIGDGAYMAHSLKIKTINDFRSNDIKHNGKGAPFAPLYHLALGLRDDLIPFAVVNCGGISNISIINEPQPELIYGFDTGPGNGLIDKFVRIMTNNAEYMDQNGKYGLNGVVNEQILRILYESSIIKNNQNFFDIYPPKALDIGDMILPRELYEIGINDGCRTLEAFTADSIIKSLDLINLSIPKKWILVGGGWNNPVILQELKNRLLPRDIEIITAKEIGWDNKALEAQIFAYLAVRSLKNLPLSYPNTTGVDRAITGGILHI